MKIAEAMLENGVRMVCGSRWAIREVNGTYTVYERLMYAKKTITVAETDSEDAAMTVLLNLNGNDDDD